MVLAAGVGSVLVVGLAATFIALSRDEDDPAASLGGGALNVQTGRDDDVKLDPKRPLSCFSAGQFVGEMPVEDCARKNGVAAGALDLGLDAAGALSASNGTTAEITPLPPDPPPALAPVADEEPLPATDGSPNPAPARASGQTCWRYEGASWTRISGAMSLGACVQALFEGDCVGPGAADYGRWGDRTLRLAGGRIETSADNHTFRTLAPQGPGCAAPPTG